MGNFSSIFRTIFFMRFKKLLRPDSEWQASIVLLQNRLCGIDIGVRTHENKCPKQIGDLYFTKGREVGKVHIAYPLSGFSSAIS